MIPNSLFLYLYALVHIFVRTGAEMFTAMCEIEQLLDTQASIITDLDRYIKHGEQKLQVLKKHLHIYKIEHEKATKDVPNYMGNPINAFTIIKRLTIDLEHIKITVNNTVHLTNITLHNKYPTLVDLTGAAKALVRLQEVYNLSVKDLSDGILSSVAQSTPMSAGDCYELGRALYNEKDFQHALAWMLQALRKLGHGSDPRPVSEADVLEYISFCHYLLDDTESALKWAKILLKVEPKHPRAFMKILDFENIIAEDNNAKLQKEQQRVFEGEEDEMPYQKLSLSDQNDRTYQSLCSKQIDVPAEATKRLRCRYLREHHPFLLLAPLKTELLYWKPRVVMFHEVLSDDEIRVIKDLAKPKLERAGIYDPETGKRIPSPDLLSKSSWVSDVESPLVARVSQRVADMTRLNMLSTEDLYVINYGIGGHYELHLDVLTNKLSKQKLLKKRIASVMFYMSDVAQGATVFPELGLRLYPRKGTAVYWLNLLPSGEGDFATVHAACPVLHGSKWVAIKWIHQEGQELRRPCTYQPESWP